MAFLTNFFSRREKVEAERGYVALLKELFQWPRTHNADIGLNRCRGVLAFHLKGHGTSLLPSVP